MTRCKPSRCPGRRLYAVGDCNGRAPLTHMGKYQARVAAAVILGEDMRDRASLDVVPRVTFTDPQVCAVGLTEAQALERGLDVRVVTCGTGEVPGAYTSAVVPHDQRSVAAPARSLRIVRRLSHA